MLDMASDFSSRVVPRDALETIPSIPPVLSRGLLEELGINISSRSKLVASRNTLEADRAGVFWNS